EGVSAGDTVSDRVEKIVGEPAATDIRRDTRHEIPMETGIEFLDPTGSVVSQESGLIINISKHEACLMSMREVNVGSRLRITITREGFTARAAVKAVGTGQGGVWNLHIEFLDKCWMGGA